MIVYDLEADGLRGLNSALQKQTTDTNQSKWEVINPKGSHAIAVGLNAPIEVTVKGSTGYYCAGMNQQATIRVTGSVGPGAGENMMSGTVIVEGDASQYAGATGHGGLLVIKGNASSRCGISMKGINIVVHGSIGHMSAFMAQAGTLVVCGDVGDALGDSLYEAQLFVRGSVKSLGADCIEKKMRKEHLVLLKELLERAETDANPEEFRRYGSARQLYNFDVDSNTTYQIGIIVMFMRKSRTLARQSATFTKEVNAEIRRAAETGIYDIRGGGAKRKVPHFDDLVFLGASVSRYPLEGYRETCNTKVTLGTRFAKNPMELDIPVTIAGMSFGALSGQAKEALGRGASSMGTSTTTGDGGMTPEERSHSTKLVYQYLPSRYGMNPDDLRKADAIEVVVGQGAKPGGGGMLLGQKISDRVAEMRTLPKGIDQRSACRHPDWTGPDDLEIKLLELREITNWNIPIYIKVGGTRPYYDTALAVKSGADVVVLDGMQGGTAATQDVFIEHVGIPILAAIRPAVHALQDLGVHREVQLVVSGGIRNGADVAKAMALGADAVSIGTAALIAMGDNDPKWEEEYQKLGSTSGAYDAWHEGQDPAGITTQDPELAQRLDPIEAGRLLRNYLKVITLEAQTIARACGHNDLRNLEPEDLCALTIEAAAMARVPLAGTEWYPGKAGAVY